MSSLRLKLCGYLNTVLLCSDGGAIFMSGDSCRSQAMAIFANGELP
jgi:hypothetical protein